MKIAEALVLRADCQKSISQLKKRLEKCAKVQEGEESPEDSEILLADLKRSISDLTVLVKKINKTNNLTFFGENYTLAEALADRDAIAIERDAMDDLIEQSTIKYDRYSRSEVKFISKINVQETQKLKDELSKQFREMDFKIQEKNWTNDLIED